MSSPFGVSATVRYWVHQDSLGLSEAELALLDDPKCKKPEHQDPPEAIPEDETEEQKVRRFCKRNMHNRKFGWGVHPIFGQFRRNDMGRYDDNKHQLPAYPPEWYFFQDRARFNPVSCKFELPPVFDEIEKRLETQLVTAVIYFTVHPGVAHSEGRYFTDYGRRVDAHKDHYAFLYRSGGEYVLRIATISLEGLNSFYRKLREGRLRPAPCFSPGVATSGNNEED